MRPIHSIALLTTTLISLAVACGSSKNSGNGQCSDFRGTYEGQLTCSDGTPESSSATVSQSGCMLTIAFSDGTTLTGTARGSKATTTQTAGAFIQTCDVTLNGNQYTQSCTVKSGGQTVDTCTGGGTRTGVPDAGGTTGAGGSGFNGAGGSTGTGGGLLPGPCGITWSLDANCETCMEAMCCDELRGCGPGTACGTLLQCAATKCPTLTATCIQTQCAAELQTGAPALGNLTSCNGQQCAACD